MVILRTIFTSFDDLFGELPSVALNKSILEK